MSNPMEEQIRMQGKACRRGGLSLHGVTAHPRRARAPLALATGPLALAACAGSPAPAAGLPDGGPAEAAVSTAAGPSAPDAGAVSTAAEPSAPDAAAPSAQGDSAGSPSQELARSDTQGAVEVIVSPSSWTREAEGTLEFEVIMDTHSVELSMDLAKLATLQTDTGLTLQALDWSGGGGHHVTRVLRFPSSTTDGQPLLDGAGLLILTIQDLDVPSRVFQWEVASLP